MRTFSAISKKTLKRIQQLLEIPTNTTKAHAKTCWHLLSHFSGLSVGLIKTTFAELSANDWQPRVRGVCRRRAGANAVKSEEVSEVRQPDSGEMLVRRAHFGETKLLRVLPGNGQTSINTQQHESVAFPSHVSVTVLITCLVSCVL